MDTRLGVLLWSQATTWSELEAGARRVDDLGHDHLWAWDHLYATFGGTPEQVAAAMIERKELGFHTFIAEMAAPFDDETLERWIGEVRPMVDAA